MAAALWPWRGREFHASPPYLIATYIETAQPYTLVAMQREIALHRWASLDRNVRLVGRLHRAFRIGLLLLAIEVAAWLVALGGQSWTRPMFKKKPKQTATPLLPKPVPRSPSAMMDQMGRVHGERT